MLDVGVDEVGFGADGGQSGCGTHNFFEEHYPWPGADHGARAPRRRGLPPRAIPEIAYVQGDACALPFADGAFDIVFSNAVIEHVGDLERQRLFVARGAARRPPRVPDDAQPLVPDRGPHEAAARALAARARRRAAPTTSPARAGRGRTTCSAARELRALFPVPVRIVNLGLTLVAIT